MRLGLLGCLLALLITGSLPGHAEQPAGPVTLESVLKSEETQEPAAAEKSATDPGRTAVRPEGTLVRPKDGVQHPDLDNAWAAYDAAVAKVADEIRGAINRQFDAATAKGDLDAAEKWQKTLDKFESAGDLPADSQMKTAMRNATSDFKRAARELATAYESVVKSLTVEKKIPEAKRARDELQIAQQGEERRPPPPRPLPQHEKPSVASEYQINAGKSWQPTIEVEKGVSYLVRAAGQWTADNRKLPLQGPGSRQPNGAGEDGLRMRVGEGQFVMVGETLAFEAKESGVLYFELWGGFKGNDRGHVVVRIERVK